ncbi:MAG: tRNA (guanosine(46)-N7)-methyltransferase TrmB [Oscillospiraceae bacterium]|nr:tRNA (guanosine(46)-N7)-methyltransferase TrmB [Oscillospiraceae bacterium]
MRKRHNLQPRMERCSEYLIGEPQRLRGTWKREGRGLLLEIGCGKGSFTCSLAEAEPDNDLIAVEKVPDAMLLAMERAKKMKLSNVRFLDLDAAGLREVFAAEEVDRIYLNFSDPWPKSRDAKFRLTAPAFLRSYADVLPVGGELRFKTDNLALFDWSLLQLEQEKWEISEKTYDLHAHGICGILTDYESRFLQEGIAIKALTAVRTAETLDSSAGEPPRLRNAALADARALQEEKK